MVSKFRLRLRFCLCSSPGPLHLPRNAPSGLSHPTSPKLGSARAASLPGALICRETSGQGPLPDLPKKTPAVTPLVLPCRADGEQPPPFCTAHLSPTPSPKKNPFWDLGPHLGAIPDLRCGSSRRRSRAPRPRGGQQSGRAQHPFSFTDSQVFNETPLINLTWQLERQVLRFPGHSPCASREFSLCSHGLPGSQRRKGRLLRGCGAWPPLPRAPTSRSSKVLCRGKPSEFLRGILSQSQLSQKAGLIQDLALSQLGSPPKSPSSSTSPEPPPLPGRWSRSAAKGTSGRSRSPTTASPPRFTARSEGDGSLHPSPPWPTSSLEPA